MQSDIIPIGFNYYQLSDEFFVLVFPLSILMLLMKPQIKLLSLIPFILLIRSSVSNLITVKSIVVDSLQQIVFNNGSILGLYLEKDFSAEAQTCLFNYDEILHLDRTITIPTMQDACGNKLFVSNTYTTMHVAHSYVIFTIW